MADTAMTYEQGDEIIRLLQRTTDLLESMKATAQASKDSLQSIELAASSIESNTSS